MADEMERPVNGMGGSIATVLAGDHRRLDEFLRRAAADSGQIDHDAYGRFRAGLLRHIGMEEKILLPAVQRLRGGEPFPVAAKLRLDHGALAALLMPTPTAPILSTIRSILTEHNGLEEGADGLYALCDELAGPEAERIAEKLRAAPEVSVMPYSDGPAVIGAVRRTLERAGYDLRDRNTAEREKPT